MIKYTYEIDGVMHTATFETPQRALRRALDDIEEFRADPISIRDEGGGMLYTEEQIGEMFLNDVKIEDDTPEPVPLKTLSLLQRLKKRLHL